jgi:hypothetical protein
MRGRALLLVVASLLLVPACAARDPHGDPPPATKRLAQRYAASATVLESKTHGPELCLGIILDSLPPQCRGLPLTNWRWDRVDGEEAAAGTIWGSYHVVGTYDGASFTVARVDAPAPQPPPPSPQERFQDEPKSPCREPEGGWKVPDPRRRSERYLEPVSKAAAAEPDFAGLWLSYLEPMGGNVAEDPGEFVLNVAFTGDLARHEAELRPLWGGRLCVSRVERSLKELRRIHDEVTRGAFGRRLGLEVLSSSVGQAENRVDVRVVVLSDEAAAAVERRYGPGVVQLSAALTPAG